MFNGMFLVIRRIVGFKRHAVVAHAFGSVFAEYGVSGAGDFSILRSPVFIYRVFFDSLPGFGGGDGDGGRGRLDSRRSFGGRSTG